VDNSNIFTGDFSSARLPKQGMGHFACHGHDRAQDQPSMERANTLKTALLLNNIYKSSPYLTGNTLRLRYKAQPVNAVWGNSSCLLRETYATHKYTVRAECSYSILKRVVYIVNTGH
jgi:hypothetical protein